MPFPPPSYEDSCRKNYYQYSCHDEYSGLFPETTNKQDGSEGRCRQKGLSKKDLPHNENEKKTFSRRKRSHLPLFLSPVASTKGNVKEETEKRTFGWLSCCLCFSFFADRSKLVADKKEAETREEEEDNSERGGKKKKRRRQ